MRAGKLKGALLLAGVAMALALPASAAAWSVPYDPQELMRGITYVAFGDSYSAGEGNMGPSSDSGWLDEKGGPSSSSCHRSPYAYPALANHYLNSPRPTPPGYHYNQRWIFLACSGAKSKDLLSDQVNSQSSIDYFNTYDHTYESFGVALGEATVTIGGNDVGFSDVLKACYEMIIDVCTAKSKDPVVSGLMQRIQAEKSQLVTDYQAILDRINNGNSWGAWPKRSLYVLTYPRIFPAKPTVANTKGCYLDAPEAKYINSAQDALNSVIKSAVARAKLRPPSKAADIRLVDTNGPKFNFAGHDICQSSGKRWFYNVGDSLLRGHLEYAYHPTVAGQAMMYMALHAEMAQDHFFGDNAFAGVK